MAEEKIHPKLIPPPISDGWRPNHTRNHKKKYGLVVFYRPWNNWFYKNGKLLKTENIKLSESVSWYATERSRNDAIQKHNKDMSATFRPPLALAKIER